MAGLPATASSFGAGKIGVPPTFCWADGLGGLLASGWASGGCISVETLAGILSDGGTFGSVGDCETVEVEAFIPPTTMLDGDSFPPEVPQPHTKSKRAATVSPGMITRGGFNRGCRITKDLSCCVCTIRVNTEWLNAY